MPFYVFDFRGTSREVGGSGAVLAGLDEVRIEAIDRVSRRMQTEATTLVKDGIIRLDVIDHASNIIYTVNVLALDVPTDEAPNVLKVDPSSLNPAGS